MPFPGWIPVSSGGHAFGVVSVSGQGDVVADASGDTLTIVAGENVTVTTSPAGDAVTIAASAGGGGNAFGTVAVSGQDDVVADAEGDTLTLAAGSNVTITTDAGTDTVTIAASAGGGGTVSTAVKTGDTARTNDDTPSNDPHLTFDVGTNEVWAIEVLILHTSAGTGADLEIGFSVPASATMYWGTHNNLLHWNPHTTIGSVNTVPLTESQLLQTGSSAQTSGLYLRGLLQTAGTAGSVAVRWSQQTSSNDHVTLKQGSLLIARKVSA